MPLKKNSHAFFGHSTENWHDAFRTWTKGYFTAVEHSTMTRGTLLDPFTVKRPTAIAKTKLGNLPPMCSWRMGTCTSKFRMLIDTFPEGPRLVVICSGMFGSSINLLIVEPRFSCFWGLWAVPSWKAPVVFESKWKINGLCWSEVN